jgi:hypothetical protein
MEMSRQFLKSGPAGEVELNHLQSAFGWLASDPDADQEARDDGQIDLDGDTILAIGEQMPATEDALEPAEKQFRLPTIMPPKSDAYIGPPRAATLPPAEGQGCSSVNYCRWAWAWSTAPKRVRPTNLVGTFVSGSSGPVRRRQPKSPSSRRG